MALTQFLFGVAHMSDIQTPGPWMYARGAVSSDIEPTASAANTDTVAAPRTSPTSPVCHVTTDTEVYISFGPAPDASSDAGRIRMLANTERTFYVAPGDKGSVVTVAGE